MKKPLDWTLDPITEQGVLDVRNVHLGIGSRTVLHDVSLRARPGRLLVLIGPNGAGKSSLLSLMAGLRPPSSGDISLDGLSLARWAPERLARRRAMLSQKIQLGFGFRVEEVVMLGRSPHGKRSINAADHATVNAALQAVQSAHLHGRNYLELSGGEQQRVQLARVLAQVWNQQEGPCWLFLDEPEAGLDIAHQHHVLRHARSLVAQGYGVIAVLHDLNLAARYADEVALMANGRLVRCGSPAHALDAAVLSKVYGIALQHSEVAGGYGSRVIVPATAV